MPKRLGIWTGKLIKRVGRSASRLVHNTIDDTPDAVTRLYRQMRVHPKVDIVLPPLTRYSRYEWPSLNPVKTQRCIVAISGDDLHIFPYEKSGRHKRETYALSGLSWFHRPRVISDDSDQIIYSNVVELHLKQNGRWFALRINSDKRHTDRLLSVIKSKAAFFHRRRAYSAFDPATAQPAVQDLQGAWSMYPAVKLVLSRDSLTVWDKNSDTRQQHYDLAGITRVQTLRRLDMGTSWLSLDMPGLVRFDYNGETHAFGLPDYEYFAMALAEMAGVQMEWWQPDKKGRKF